MRTSRPHRRRVLWALALMLGASTGAGVRPVAAADWVPVLDPNEPVAVWVRVEVDPAGVVQAAMLVGDAVPRGDAALAAARALRFPAVDGPGVRVLLVGFRAADGAAPDVPAVLEVAARRIPPDAARATTTVDAAALAREAGADLTEALQLVPGLRAAPGAADVTKPILRGMQERRLLLLVDGVRHESQKWGADHAPEIDPFAAGQITVVRGPAGARYGPDAMGGVILVEPPPLRTAPGVGGTVLGAGSTNGRRAYGAARLDLASAARPGLAGRLEGNLSDGAALSTPDYVLGNTASRVWNLGGTVGWRWDGGAVQATVRHHALRAGVFYGVRTSTPADFEAQLDAPRPATAALWRSTRTIDRPRQEVGHTVVLLRLRRFGAAGELDAAWSFQRNARAEFEQVRDPTVGPQYDFLLRTHALDVAYHHPALGRGQASLHGTLGVQGSFQENVYVGYALIPNHRAFGGGVFGIERLVLPRGSVEAALRVDGLSRAAFFLPADLERHRDRGALDADDCTPTPPSVRCPAAWGAPSASVGAVRTLWPSILEARADLSLSTRFPSPDELYLIGTAPTFPVFAEGRPDLQPERARGASAGLSLDTRALDGEFGFFAQAIDDFIYFSPVRGADGAPAFDVTIRGTWPRYGFRPVNAVVRGVDGAAQLGPEAVVGLDLRGALVRVHEPGQSVNLVGTPPDVVAGDLVVRPPLPSTSGSPELRVTVEHVAQQSRADPVADFAPPPAARTLLGASLDLTVGRRRPVRLGLDGRNLLNTRFREYTSLIRYYADQPGRDLRLRVAIDF